MAKDFTVLEVLEGLKCCEREDCENCPIGIHLALFDCEITLLRLSRQAIERYREEYEKLLKKSEKKSKKVTKNDKGT